MEHTMLADGLMEVRGAEYELQARLYAQEKTGLDVERILYVAAGVYQVTLR